METNTEREKLHSSILDAIKSRSAWEERQVQFYEMRHRGIRRKHKPFPTASDLHWPLIDTNIEKLKPLFFRQIIGMDTVASFVPMKPQSQAANSVAEQWFDFKIRERSNLQEVALSWIDYALLSGRSMMKVHWDFDDKRLRFEALPTLNSIVPTNTRGLDEADWWVHVISMSRDFYRRSDQYDQSEEVVNAIFTTSNYTSVGNTGNDKETRNLREGITHPADENRCIVWEVYRRAAGKVINILTYSPQAPDKDLRPPRVMAMNIGGFPVVDFPYEITDGGWYSPRGIAEILAPFELSLCNTWNHKHDAMAYFNRPMFRSEKEMPNTANLRINPGGVLPNGLVPVTNAQPPMNFDDEINQTRSVAEARIANPDFGVNSDDNPNSRRTATEIKAISAEAVQSGDLRSRMFRSSLGRVYKMAWKLLLQHDKESLTYRYHDELQEADAAALHDEYEIEPKGGLNDVNRTTKVNEAIAIKQLLANSQFWDQSVLEKNIIALQEPMLIKTAFRDPNVKVQLESEDEAKNIPALLIGGMLPPHGGEDEMTRIGVLMAFLQKSVATKVALPPDGVNSILARLDGLVQGLEQKDKNAGRQMRKNIMQFVQSSGLMPAQPQQNPQGQPPAPVAPPVPAPTAPPPAPPRPRSMRILRDNKNRITGATEEIAQ